ncbi:MAG TPA: hypothetical protein VD978_16165 [Azospirillum sp.]|nr:hypothetical protein [Azospirillum sp.]
MTDTNQKRADLLLRVLRLSRHPDAAAALSATLDMLDSDFADLPDADVTVERAVEFAFRMRLHETMPDTWSAFVLEMQAEAERALTTRDDHAVGAC